MYESVACPLTNTNFFNVSLDIGNIKYHFFGHDHRNDYHAKYDDVSFNFLVLQIGNRI